MGSAPGTCFDVTAQNGGSQGQACVSSGGSVSLALTGEPLYLTSASE